MTDSKAKRFSISECTGLALLEKVESIKELLSQQLDISEQLRKASQGIDDKEIRDSTGDAIEFGKAQLSISQKLTDLIFDVTVVCKSIQDDNINHVNDLDKDQIDSEARLNKKIGELETYTKEALKPITDAGVFYKYRKQIIITLGAVAAGVLSAVKMGWLGK